VFIVGSCARFRSFRIHSSVNVESEIVQITKEKEVQRSEHRQRHTLMLQKRRSQRRVEKSTYR